MSESLCVISGCARPRPREQFMCRGCVHKLERSLGDVPALWRELTITLTRQDAIGTDGGRKSADSGLPFKPNASEARWNLANVIGTWARDVAERAGISQPPAKPARWLLLNVQSIAMHPAADEVFDEITDAVRQAYRAIDRMPDLLLAGVCDGKDDPDGDEMTECKAPLYARATDDTVNCPECGAVHQTSERRDAMADAAEEVLVTADEALTLAHKLLDHVIPRNTWDSWVSRKRIFNHGLNINGRATYLFGEVRDLAEQWHANVIKRGKRVA